MPSPPAPSTPPVFETLAPRSYAAEGADARAAYPHPHWRSTHADLYPDLKSLTLDVPPEEALERVQAVAAATLHWLTLSTFDLDW